MKQTKNEDGLVAILVATVIMIIMSLITLGFARLMQREQRQAADRALSSQAFYAAESGVNDAIAIIHNGTPVVAKNTCATTGAVSSATNAYTSCLLINPTPDSLEYSPGKITTSTSMVIPVSSPGGATAVKQFKLAWEPESVSGLPDYSTYTCSGAVSALPDYNSWPANTSSVLRVDLVPLIAPLGRDSLNNNTISVYLYPTSCAGATYPSAALSKGQILPVNCTLASRRACEVTFILAPSIQTGNYYLRVRSVYSASSMSVRIYDVAGQINIEGSQVEIDSTGKVADVLRRVQVHVPAKLSYPVPDFGVESMDSICKQITTSPNVGAVSDGCTHP